LTPKSPSEKSIFEISIETRYSQSETLYRTNRSSKIDFPTVNKTEKQLRTGNRNEHRQISMLILQLIAVLRPCVVYTNRENQNNNECRWLRRVHFVGEYSYTPRRTILIPSRPFGETFCFVSGVTVRDWNVWTYEISLDGGWRRNREKVTSPRRARVTRNFAFERCSLNALPARRETRIDY